MGWAFRSGTMASRGTNGVVFYALVFDSLGKARLSTQRLLSADRQFARKLGTSTLTWWSCSSPSITHRDSTESLL